MTNALIINRSGYLFERPRPSLLGSLGIGIASTNLIHMTSSGSRSSIQLCPSIDVSQLICYGGHRALAMPQRGTRFVL